VALIERGGVVLRGRSWKGRRGAPAWGGGRGGDGRAEGWLEEVALSGLGCAGRRQHGVRSRGEA
jgi:hypothetical protein